LQLNILYHIIKPAQCCIKLVFHLTYTMMHGSTKLKFSVWEITIQDYFNLLDQELFF